MGFWLAEPLQNPPFCLGELNFLANIYPFHCAVNLQSCNYVIFSKELYVIWTEDTSKVRDSIQMNFTAKINHDFVY